MAEKKSNRFSKPVAFNDRNEKDQQILKHVSRRNFSGYVKKLIWEDMMTKAQPHIAVIEPLNDLVEQSIIEAPKMAETASERIERIKREVSQQKH